MKEVVAALIILNKKILIARRANNIQFSGFYELPGGKIEENETPEEALNRELNEELGINCLIKDFFQEIKWENKFLLKCYFVDINEKDVSKMEKRVHDDFQWVNLKNYTQYKLLPADIKIMENLKQSFYSQLF
jgi:8-oxo-dGTP diphosphatase